MSDKYLLAGNMPIQHVLEPHERLEALKFDPLMQAVAIAKGEELTSNHPFLKLTQSWCDDRIMDITDDPENLLDRKTYDDFLVMAEKFLTDSWVNHDLRYKSTMDLLQYQHSKRKPVEKVEVDSGGGEGSVKTPLSRAEIVLFHDVFNAEF